MKDVELKLISELMKNSRRSDRVLAKAIGISQPTVTRSRTKLEKQKIIKEYTMIPDFRKIGYQILAINLFKYKKSFDAKKVEMAKDLLQESFQKGPFEIIMAERGTGAGYDAVMISIHRDYQSFVKLMQWAKEFSEFELDAIESFLVNLSDEVHYRSLTLSSIAKDTLTVEEKRE